MTPRKRQERDRRIGDAMKSLVGNQNFDLFMESIREQREIAILDACNDVVVQSQRASMAAIGEIKCYTNILDLYDAAQSQAAESSDPDD